MFIENQAQFGNYYYPRTTELFALNGVSSGGFANQLHALSGPSGKTWEDFVPVDWYHSSVYRNILDQLNTLDVVRRNLWAGFLGAFVGWPKNINPTPPSAKQFCPYANRFTIGTDQAFTGWAITQKNMPKSKVAGTQLMMREFWPGQGWNKDRVNLQYYPAVVRVLQQAGYKPNPRAAVAKYQGVMSPCIDFKSRDDGADAVWRHNALIANGNGYTADDLVNLVRSLDWEMNRVHLPIPFNLRQWSTEFRKHSIGGGSMSFYQYGRGLKQLKNWIVIMKEKVRKAIDASNLARKVAEESLRKEDARILKERADERKRREAARRLAIEEERKRAAALIAAERKRLMEQAQAERAQIAQEAKIKASETPVQVPPEIQDVARSMVVSPVEQQLIPSKPQPPTVKAPEQAVVEKAIEFVKEKAPERALEIARANVPQEVAQQVLGPTFPIIRKGAEAVEEEIADSVEKRATAAAIPWMIGAGAVLLLVANTRRR